MSNSALVIIDMQTGFHTAKHEGTIRNVIKAIKIAQDKQIPIVVLEYESMGRTLPRIRKYLDDYSKTIYQIKRDDDGSRMVIRALKNNGYKGIKTLDVCGVNITACVSSTVRSLANDFEKMVTVIKNACWGHGKNRKQDFYCSSYAYRNENVNLINVGAYRQT